MCEDHLVEWAKWTEEEFDSIVVVLEDPENIPSPTLDAFFASLSHLRSRHHLPIDVILMDAMPGGMGDRLSRLRQPSFHNAGGGEGGGAVIQEVFLPEPGVQFDMFVDKLFSNENRIPTFLWNNTDLFRHLHEIYRECDNSVISLARELKSVLNRYFAKPGTFLSMLHCGEFVLPNSQRLSWILGDIRARSFLASNWPFHLPSQTVDEGYSYIHDSLMRMHTSMLYTYFHKMLRTLLLVNATPSDKATQAPQPRDEWKAVSRETIRGIIALLRDIRNDLAREVDYHPSIRDVALELRSSMRMRLNKFVILVGNLASSKEPNPDTWRAVMDRLIRWFDETFAWQGFKECASFVSTVIQPRRDVAVDLYRPPPMANCPLAQARRLAFRVLQSRRITCSEWYDEYYKIVSGDEKDVPSAVAAEGASPHESAFFFAIAELVHCGIVRKVPAGRRNEDMYEKVAIVWGLGR
mmetsp:Transcript_4706/g.9702  ORF Transcript_4706/g.9702 Transcript_4706/m.9702 type:complete len:466 (+) Transcript_4706:257-1654(+)